LDELQQIEPLDDKIRTQIPNNKFIIGYTGTIGAANAIDTFLEAHKYIDNDDIIFVIVGDGQEKPKLIGPVRSLRLYDVEWVAAFDASIGHVGGSAAALREVRNGNYRDIDQFFNPGSYWRASDRYAPHNVYTNFSRLDALNKAKGYTTSKFTGFSRIDAEPVEVPDATSIDIKISGFLYDSHYTYNQKTNKYARNQAGEKHLDREDGQITPSVIVAMNVNETSVLKMVGARI